MKTLPKNWKPDENTNWEFLASEFVLTEDFMRKYQDKLNWFWISIDQKLSEEFAKEFEDKLNWNQMSYYQDVFSEEFLIEFKNKINWMFISIRKKNPISKRTINKFQYLIYSFEKRNRMTDAQGVYF